MTPVAVTKAAGTPTPSGRRHWLRDADWECSVPALGGRVETVPLPAGDAADEAGDQTAVPVLLPLGDGAKAGTASLCLLLPDLAEVVSIVADHLASQERETRRRLRRKASPAPRRGGIRFGRTPISLPENFQKALELWHKGNLSVSGAARLCGMRRPHSIVRRRPRCGKRLQGRTMIEPTVSLSVRTSLEAQAKRNTRLSVIVVTTDRLGLVERLFLSLAHRHARRRTGNLV